MGILKKPFLTASLVLFSAYVILIMLLVFESLRIAKNEQKIKRLEVEYEHEFKKPTDEAEKTISEERKSYYETLYHK